MNIFRKKNILLGIDFSQPFEACLQQSRQRRTVRTFPLPPLDLGSLLLTGHTVLAVSLPSGHRSSLVSGRQTGGMIWSTTRKVTDMSENNAPETAPKNAAPRTRRLYLPADVVDRLADMANPNESVQDVMRRILDARMAEGVV